MNSSRLVLRSHTVLMVPDIKWTSGSHDRVVRFIPPLGIGGDDLRTGVGAFTAAAHATAVTAPAEIAALRRRLGWRPASAPSGYRQAETGEPLTPQEAGSSGRKSRLRHRSRNDRPTHLTAGPDWLTFVVCATRCCVRELGGHDM